MQLALFDSAPPLPDGFRYAPAFLEPLEEQALIDWARSLPFQHFRWHEYTGKRRTVTFGWSYSFDRGDIQQSEALPPPILSLRDRAATWARIPREALVQALVTEYLPGAAIGWHRDAPPFGVVLGISLSADCRFRLRLEEENEKRELTVERRSIYLLSGAARTVWQHSIPPAEETRYSITLRTLRQGKMRNPSNV